MYQRQVSFQEAIVRAIQGNYFNFSGRASRSEFWWFELFNLLVNSACSVLTVVMGDTIGTAISVIIGLLLILPTLGLMARRLHDVGRSGWWLLLLFTGIGVLLLIVWWIMPSQEHPNEYGDEPNMVA